MKSMPADNSKHINLLLVTVVALLLLVGAYLANSFGMITLGKGEFVTVIGTSTAAQPNQIATFSVNVQASNSDKDLSVADMTTKADELIGAIKVFGIADADIKTENINVYQEQNYDQATQTSIPGNWRASEGVTIKLRDMVRASEFVTMLSTNTSVDSMYGPSFEVDSKSTDENSLLVSALADAAVKAGAVAKASGRQVGAMVSFYEGVDSSGNVGPLYARGMGGGGGNVPVEVGTTDVSKTVTVTYRLR